MISFIQGKVCDKTEKTVIIETGGIGYQVFCSPQTLEQLFKGREQKLFTHFCLSREKAELYGFLNIETLELFETLEGFSGVGPRTALILSCFGSLEKLKKTIEAKDNKFFTDIKGIGRKKLQKIVLELTGKIEELNKQSREKNIDPVLATLISLGFSQQESQLAFSQIPTECVKTEEKIKKALEILGADK
ncbi:MAG: Holliday junction branch migration protein RuvA [Methanosarcinales archaeon]|nr:Holliday junction branch migration protein RuvA [Methanosarcinales archaeon]